MIRIIEVGALDLDSEGDTLADETVRMPVPDHLKNKSLKETVAWAVAKINGG